LILFLDTSALVKIYIAEPGSERMREAVAREEPKVASVLAFAEILAHPDTGRSRGAQACARAL
jgi:uncharacterized protein with PIN domain